MESLSSETERYLGISETFLHIKQAQEEPVGVVHSVNIVHSKIELTEAIFLNRQQSL